ncbi:hypothetical protein A6R68_11489, partial [Neotoma lepida]
TIGFGLGIVLYPDNENAGYKRGVSKEDGPQIPGPADKICTALEKLLPHSWGNVGFVFTNEDLTEIRDMLLDSKVQAVAHAGAITPYKHLRDTLPELCCVARSFTSLWAHLELHSSAMEKNTNTTWAILHSPPPPPPSSQLHATPSTTPYATMSPEVFTGTDSGPLFQGGQEFLRHRAIVPHEIGAEMPNGDEVDLPSGYVMRVLIHKLQTLTAPLYKLDMNPHTSCGQEVQVKELSPSSFSVTAGDDYTETCKLLGLNHPIP